MAFTRTWNAAYEAQPADTENISIGASRIRDLKTDIQERLVVDHAHAGNADDGKHKQITLLAPLGADPANIANHGFLYTKDVSGKVEFFWEDEDGNVVQLTVAGVINALANVITTRGDIVRGGVSGVTERHALGADKTFLGSDGTDALFKAVPLDDLSDVVITAPATDAILAFDGANWIDFTPPFTKFFESAEQTIALGANDVIAHGLGAIPRGCEVWLRNKTAQHGWVANDEVSVVKGHQLATVGGTGITIGLDGTNITLVYGAQRISVFVKSAGTTGVITVGNWRAIVRAWI